MQGFETCNTVQICTGYVHKEILIYVIIAELFTLEYHTCFGPSNCSTVLVSASSPTVFDAGI